MGHEWSPQQRAIGDWFEDGTGHLIIRARAGTGKTTTIIWAIGRIPGDGKILVCAYNKRIQMELQQRLDDERAEAKTYHALGFAFVRQQWRNVKPDDNVEWDRIDKAYGGRAPDELVVPVRRLVGFAKNITPFGTVEDLEALAYDYDCLPAEGTSKASDVARVARKAMDIARDERDAEGRITFDDMIWLPVVLNYTRPWFTHVIVDEAQDTCRTQLLLAQGACRRQGRIILVGDDRQAIYTFRGADPDGLDRMKQELSATELPLSITYRCPKRVVALAQALVPDYSVGDGAPDGVVREVYRGALHEHAQPGDAVLSRANAPLPGLCLGLLKRGIPARIEGRDLGKALAEVARKLKARSVPDFLERLRGWQKRQVARATSQWEARMASERRSESHSARDRLKQKIEDVSDQVETLAGLAEGATSVEEVLDRCVRLFVDSEAGGTRTQVVCSTVHRAKGLEWDRVFVLRSTIGWGKREEENIHYVAITRAKRELVWITNEPPAVAAPEVDNGVDAAVPAAGEGDPGDAGDDHGADDAPDAGGGRVQSGAGVCGADDGLGQARGDDGGDRSGVPVDVAPAGDRGGSEDEASWRCAWERCATVNPATARSCVSCEMPRPVAA